MCEVVGSETALCIPFKRYLSAAAMFHDRYLGHASSTSCNSHLFLEQTSQDIKVDFSLHQEQEVLIVLLAV